MLLYRVLLTFLFFYFVSETLCKPTEDNVTEGRGIGSTLWGWITYPFSWWSSSEVEPPVSDQLIGSTTLGPYDNIEIGRHNVTVWCNDQTCTTMKCDKFGCKNNTCNIYDTDMAGECREYATKPDEVAPTKTTEIVPKPEPQVPNIAIEPPQQSTTINIATPPASHHSVDERPLELEAVLSSTVTDADKKGSSDDTKVNSDSEKV